MNILKVGMVQQSCGDDIQANIEKLKGNIRKCAELGAQLVVLQELHNSVYFCKHEEAALCDLADHRQKLMERLQRNWALSLSFHYSSAGQPESTITLL